MLLYMEKWKRMSVEGGEERNTTYMEHDVKEYVQVQDTAKIFFFCRQLHTTVM